METVRHAEFSSRGSQAFIKTHPFLAKPLQNVLRLRKDKAVSDSQKTKDGVTASGQRAEAYCRYHCATCSRHFASLEAFDAHRRGEFEPESTIEGRHCVGLEHLPKTLAAKYKVRTGVCTLSKGSSRLVLQPIWGSSETLDKGVFNAS